MKKYYRRLQWKLYRNLARKLTHFIPEEYQDQTSVNIFPSLKKKGQDEVIIIFQLPHSLIRKLMWSMKAWRAD